MVGGDSRTGRAGGGDDGGDSRRHCSVDVLREPAEALAVALPLQHRAHEQLQRPPGQLRPRHLALWRTMLLLLMDSWVHFY